MPLVGNHLQHGLSFVRRGRPSRHARQQTRSEFLGEQFAYGDNRRKFRLSIGGYAAPFPLLHRLTLDPEELCQLSSVQLEKLHYPLQ